MVTLDTTLLAALGGLVAILLMLFRQSGKKAGAKAAKAEAAVVITKVKVEAINEKADQVQAMPSAAKYDAVLERFLRKRLGHENKGRAKP